MKAIIKEGKKLLFLEGASAKNYEDIQDSLIVNFNSKGVYGEWSYFDKNTNSLIIITNEIEDVVLRFSAPLKDVVFDHWDYKDQVVFKIIKE